MKQSTYSFGLGSLISFLGVIMFISYAQAAPKSELLPGWSEHIPASTISVDHQSFDQFLEKYRSIGPQDIALIAYASVSKEDHASLQSYLTDLQKVETHLLNRQEQFVFWVNLYNSATIDLILRYKPEESIRDINISPGFFSSGPWGKAFLQVRGKELSLDNIEHGILRPLWKDPRTHYVLNCASLGCPDIPERALKTEGLENTLNAAARIYINHPRAVRFNNDQSVTLSKIYDWFESDFGGTRAKTLAHIKAYTDTDEAKRLDQTTAISGYRYDWSLNSTNNNQ